MTNCALTTISTTFDFCSLANFSGINPGLPGSSRIKLMEIVEPQIFTGRITQMPLQWFLVIFLSSHSANNMYWRVTEVVVVAAATTNYCIWSVHNVSDIFWHCEGVSNTITQLRLLGCVFLELHYWANRVKYVLLNISKFPHLFRWNFVTTVQPSHLAVN